MSSFAKISIRFNADLKQFSSEMENAQRTLDKVGKKMQNIGAGLTVGLTLPILALGAKSVQAFNEQAQALAQVEAGLKSTGNAVGFTSKKLQDMASDLQKTTLFGDEEILKNATAQLLTFTNIAGTQFERTQKAALDLAARLDGDLKSSSIQLGKALNDPVKNLSALSRSGIQFSASQKQVINALAESGRLAEAQTVILDELEKQYGGSAEAAARAGNGPLKQFSMVIGDITEQFGELILEYLNPLALKLKALAERFTNLDDSTKKTILIIAGLAAALGPVLVIMGTLATTVIPAVGAAIAVLTGPIGLVIAAVTALGFVVYKNWDSIKKNFQDLQQYFVDLYNESLVFRVGIEQVILAFKTLMNVAGLVFDVIGSFFTAVIEQVKVFGDLFGAVMRGEFGSIPGLVKKAAVQSAVNFGQFVKDAGKDLDVFTGKMKTDISAALDGVTKNKRIVFTAENVDATAITTAVTTAISEGIGEGSRAKIQTIDISGLTSSLAPIQQGPLDLIAERMPAQVEQMSEAQMRAISAAIEFNEGFNAILQDVVQNTAIGFGQILGNMMAGTAGIQDIGNLVVGAFADMAIMVGELAIRIGLTLEGVKAALASINPILAVAAGIALVALGTLFKSGMSKAGTGGSGSMPRFANGGLVYGPTVGLIGEYSGASSNPEVIAPLDKLKGMIADVVGNGGAKLSGEFVVRGRDLVYILDAAQQYDNRRR